MGDDYRSVDAWKCAICCELLHKPAANYCGHFFCFWCIHRAMSPFTESRCPLCRAKYGHFPHVVLKLHSYLNAVFPKEYQKRCIEVNEEEERSNVASPEFPDLPAAKSTPTIISEEDFLCDVCNKLLYKPSILNCGHIVCGVPRCLNDKPLSTSTSAPYPVVCGKKGCGEPSAHRPNVCKKLEDLLQQCFPDKYNARQAEIESLSDTQLLSQTPAAHTDTPVVTVTSDLDGSSAANNRDMPRGLTGPHAAIWKWLQGKDYAHYGIGCDACGQYPIIGRRYRCKDCPEAVGFDLCGDCYDRGVGSLVGRFNQKHTPEHTMEQTRPRLTSLHMLSAANPELSFDQLMFLLELGRRDETNEENTNTHTNNNQEEGRVQGADGNGPQHAENPGYYFSLRRGPRPVEDPHALWPSPSALPPRVENQGEGEGEGEEELHEQ